MADDKKQTPPTQPPAPGQPTPDQPKKKKLSLEIDEVDTSEVLERKISA
jgi:hypothetical protein